MKKVILNTRFIDNNVASMYEFEDYISDEEISEILKEKITSSIAAYWYPDKEYADRHWVRLN